MRNREKKIVYWSFSAVVIAITLFIGGNVVYNNFTSWSRGPVHWHADFTIDICGNELTLPGSKSIFSNRVGTDESHHHEDMRIHLEGVMMERETATLGFFFRAIGGELTSTSITVPTESGTATWKNGDKCHDGSVGTLRVYANGTEIENFPDYVISPYQDVPPGDKIRFVFGEDYR
jgi:hypothetical protein